MSYRNKVRKYLVSIAKIDAGKKCKYFTWSDPHPPFPVYFSDSQFSRKLKEGPGGDPILPAASFFCPGLAAELQELGVSKPQAHEK